MHAELFTPADGGFINRLTPDARNQLSDILSTLVNQPADLSPHPLYTDPDEQMFWEITHPGEEPAEANRGALDALTQPVLTVEQLESVAAEVNRARIVLTRDGGNPDLLALLNVITEDITYALMTSEPPEQTTTPPR